MQDNKMQAVRIHPSTTQSAYSVDNPAPTSSLHIDQIDIPTPAADELLIRIEATTIIRDMLTWPETYAQSHTIPGHDFSGTVAAAPSRSPFKVDDEVFGMVPADRPSTWAQYAIVRPNEVAHKPSTLSWGEAAALPLSAQTAYEALFKHAGLAAGPLDGHSSGDVAEGPIRNRGRRVLITGAAGGVGIYLVQLAAWAGVHVVAGSGSNERNREFLQSLGADEVVEYESLGEGFDVVVDCVGGKVLERCWGVVREGGVLVSVDSASFDFVNDHQKRGIARDGVRALFFIIEGDGETLGVLGDLANRRLLRSFVAATFDFEKVREAYDFANGRFEGRGKVVLAI